MANYWRWIQVLLHLVWTVTPVGSEKGEEPLPSFSGDQVTLVTYESGQTAELFCSVTNLGDRTVTWRKLPNRSPLTIGTRTWVKDSRVHAEHVPNSSQWNLVIEKVNITDAGTYECQVSARGKQFRHTITLEVKELPARRYPRIEISGRNYLKQGETIHLQCNATMVDVSIDNLEWLKDGHPIAGVLDQLRMRIVTSVSLSEQLSGSISSTLEINDAQVSDSGVYVCRSTERSQLAGVKLQVKPGASNTKRAENIQEYTGAARGLTGRISCDVFHVLVTSCVSLLLTSLGRQRFFVILDNV